MPFLKNISVSAVIFLVAGCGGGGGNQASDHDASSSQVVEVIATDYAFQLPEEIPSGWTTFRFKNEGSVVHFFLLNKLPDGVSFADYVGKVGPAFDQSWRALQNGEDRNEAIAILGRMLPEWYGAVRQMGGGGFVSGGRTGETTLKLEPGSYVLECYIKTAEGEFHSALGMIRHLTVSGGSSDGVAPEAGINLTLRNYAIEMDGHPVAGRNRFAVHFAEHPEFGLGNDVHLARLADGVPIEELVVWMDWMELCGLKTPAPAQFLGGTQEMPVGQTAFFTADLEPGRYVLLAESSAAKGMVLEFRIE